MTAIDFKLLFNFGKSPTDTPKPNSAVSEKKPQKLLEVSRGDNSSKKGVSLVKNENMTTEEAAEFLRVGKKRLLNMVSAGQIPYHKLGRSNRYRRSELEKLLTNNKRGPRYG